MSSRIRGPGSPHIDIRQYIDKGVQTDDCLVSILNTPGLVTSDPRCSTDTASYTSNVSVSSTCESPPTTSSDTSGGAYSHVGDSSNEFSDPSPRPSIGTAKRELKRRQIPRAWPSTPTGRKVTSRILSLPETASAYSAKEVFEETTLRVVSMPLPEQYSHDIYSGSLENSLIDADEESPRVRVRSQATDLPHTPSPPSSPESIVFIANKTQLPERFLRNRTHLESSRPTHTDDEGWVSWAKSPPRPIPALHGPLSLPYARCPSGAEGTIIEEPDNLSRMIWGLEGEDSAATRGRSEFLSQPQSHSTPNRSHRPTMLNQANLPPRLQKSPGNVESADSKDFSNRRVRPHAPYVSREHKPHASKNQRQDAIDSLLHGQDPIDLGHILRLQSENLGYDRNYDFIGDRTLNSSMSDLRISHLGDESEVDWRSVLLGQSKSRNLGLSPGSIHKNSHAVSGTRDSTMSTSGLPAASATRSPIILDSLAGHLPFASHDNTPRRMSALEIAHKFRQQQLQHHLPTPPSSSSPLWSSDFSPYQESLWSPELIAASALPRMSSAGLAQQTALGYNVPEIRKTISDKVTTASAGNIGRRPQFLSPNHKSQAQDLSNILQGSPVFSAAGYTADASLMRSLAEYFQIHDSRLPDIHVQAALEHALPAVPRPPPNTPYATNGLSVRDTNSRRGVHVPSPLTATPPSPTSPKPRLRSFSHQQTRSIPLTRLIQRRLSSVPEEDIEQRLSPSPANSPARARSYSSGGVANASAHAASPPYLYTPPSPLDQGPTTRRASHEALLEHSHAVEHYPGPGWMQSDRDSMSAQATVRLPSVNVHRAQAGSALGNVSGRDDPGRRKEGGARGQEGGRGRGARRGGRGKKGRGGSSAPASAMNGPQRVDGGMMVKS